MAVGINIAHTTNTTENRLLPKSIQYTDKNITGCLMLTRNIQYNNYNIALLISWAMNKSLLSFNTTRFVPLDFKYCKRIDIHNRM